MANLTIKYKDVTRTWSVPDFIAKIGLDRFLHQCGYKGPDNDEAKIDFVVREAIKNKLFSGAVAEANSTGDESDARDGS